MKGPKISTTNVWPDRGHASWVYPWDVPSPLLYLLNGEDRCDNPGLDPPVIPQLLGLAAWHADVPHGAQSFPGIGDVSRDALPDSAPCFDCRNIRPKVKHDSSCV